tara:strand:+ start:62 stop:463 length:402 start_codon:yes stop_codon:yes gene_type:complete
MNEELQNALGALLNKANNGIDTAGEFLASELPDVIQQLLMWHGIKSFVSFISCIIVMILAIAMLVKALKNKDLEGHWAYASSSYELLSFNGILVCMSSVISIIPALVNINIVWLQIWIAPKLWLIEYAAKLAS